MYSEILDDGKKGDVPGFWHPGLVFTGYGITINRVMGDSGPGFRSRLFNPVLAARGIKHACSHPYQPQAGGTVERYKRGGDG